MLDEHFRIALASNRIVVNALNEWLLGTNQIGEDDCRKVTDLEEKGDDLKRLILLELAKANALIQREDLLRLVHYNDKLIDGAEIACHHLAAVIKNWSPEGELKEKISKLGVLVIETITELREAVRHLSINMENSIKSADSVCKLEKEIDVLQRQIISLVYPADLDIAILLRFRDFLNMMEDISNFCEDAAISIRSLSLTLNT
ncbi:MAG: DUF47 domain-containing protein [Candidatus Thorarchaeota archaeon]